MANASRRGFLTAGAASVAVTGGSAALALASGARNLDRLWTALLDLEAQGVAISREIHEAEARLPWWAAPSGPKYLVAEGEPEHQATSWAPAIQGMERPRPGAFRVIRPTRADIEADHAIHVRLWGDRPSARAVLERRLAEFEARRQARENERANLGLPALDAREEAYGNRLCAARVEIDALPSTLDTIAARTLLAVIDMGCRWDSIEAGNEAGAVLALTGLRPMLSGAVAASVADFLDNPARPFCFSPLWGSYWPADEDPEGKAWKSGAIPRG